MIDSHTYQPSHVAGCRCRVLWLVEDEVALYVLPPLLDRMTMVGSHRLCRDLLAFERLISEYRPDVGVLPKRMYTRGLASLAKGRGTKLVLSAPYGEELAAQNGSGRNPDAWIPEQGITASLLGDTFLQLMTEPVTDWGAEPGSDPAPHGVPPRSRELDRLTERERVVLRLLAQGRSNQQIATTLGISIHGVKRHVSNLLLKLDCSNRTEAALKFTRPELFSAAAEA
ncbi:response regulator transcription factor [Nonomuraea helvata]|uniref:Response regulator transcription factor n=1 Tax=Nonomuraea helvata TaxID=37484 RepID=A0ABV5SDX5_9ACTN